MNSVESKTTPFPTTQTFTFEVRLQRVGMDFSMGQMTDELRKAVVHAMSNIARDVRVACQKIEVDR